MIILLLKYLRNTYLRLSQTHRVAKDTTQMRSALRIWWPRSAQRQVNGASRLLHAEGTQLKVTVFRIELKFHEYRKINRSFGILWLQRTHIKFGVPIDVCSDICTL